MEEVGYRSDIKCINHYRCWQVSPSDLSLCYVPVFVCTDATTMYESGFAKQQVFTDEQVYGTPDYIAPEVILRSGYGK